MDVTEKPLVEELDNSVGKPEFPAKRMWPKVLAIVLVSVALTVSVGMFFRHMQQKIDSIQQRADRQQQLLDMANQACKGLPSLDTLKVLTTSQKLFERDAAGRIAGFGCDIGRDTKSATQGRDVAKVDSEGREMGAEVLYFDTGAHADAYQKQKINPQRYWSVPNQPLTADIPVFKYYTAYIFGNPVYYDAYALKGNTIIRLTLPCGPEGSSGQAAQACVGRAVDEGRAIDSLRKFAQYVEPLSL